MDKCFCIQPFDGGIYDKRFDDVFKPAIESSGLEPYRVDRDPTVSIPIEDIENGIKNSRICFAEISTDNPNVWFELGFAIAVPKNVVMICSDQRKSKFPFDIQHRAIINYKTESSSDYDELKIKIKDRILALLKKDEEISKLKNISPVAETEGLSPHEIVALVTVMQNTFSVDDSVSAYTIKTDMNNAGFTDIAVSLALRLLSQKKYIISQKEQDYNGNEYIAYRMQELGTDWLIQNQQKLILQKSREDDLPF